MTPDALQIVSRVLTASASHVISGGIWYGAVFMGSVVDWPSARLSVDQGKFPFDFIVGQGSRVFPWVNLGMVVVLISGRGRVWLHPPGSPSQWGLLILKAAALLWMAGSTLYGTLVSWPKLQFATHEEALGSYTRYIRRAYLTFACGVLASAFGVAYRV
jgi:hypothetical protein